jgi:hypothetical protein
MLTNRRSWASIPFWVMLGLVLLCPAAARSARAQVLYGSIVGTVTDQTGAVVPGAVVTAKNTSTGLERQATTDATGYYSVPNLQEGTYDLSVTASGFSPYTQTGVNVPINIVTRIDIPIRVGGIAEQVSVEASSSVLQTTKADVSTTLNEKAIENLPLSNYRNYQTLINLVPGATPAQFQNAITDTPGRSLTTNVNGQERGGNNTRLDGSADILVTMPHHAVYVPPVESIEEVNISTNSFDAEQGMTGGAAVTIITKSGTNDFRGGAFGAYTNQALRTFTWDENFSGVTDKPKETQHNEGANVGGPIKKNKLFFFANWEGTFQRVNRSNLYSVPTPDFRAGDFSRMLGANILDASGNPILIPTTEGGTTPLREGMVFDPFSGDPIEGTGRSVFSSGGRINVIPAGRLNGPMKTMLDLVPLPNQEGDLDNYFNSGTQRLNRNNFDSKVNWNRNDRHQLFFKYSVMDALVHGDFGLGAAGGSCVCDGGVGDGHTLVQIGGIGQTYTVSPTLVLDGTFGWTRFGQNVEPPDLGTNFGLDVLGIPGTNGPDPRESGMPQMSISGYSDLGNTESWNPLYRNDQSFTFNTNASWTKGEHDIRFGFDYVHHTMKHWQPELGYGPRGAFGFESAVTALNPEALDASVGFQDGTPSFENDWNGLAGFLLGTPTFSGKSSQFIKMTSFENQYALYVRDRWRPTSKLTLDLGLRWELYPNRTREDGLGIESYDPETNEALIGGRGGIPRDNGVGYSKKLFAPRVGFTYQLDDATVVRSGFGITYNPHPWGAQALRGWYPLTLIAVFNGVNGYQPVNTSPGYVGVPATATLGPDLGIPSICCPDISTGRVPLPGVAETGYPRANQELHRGYIQSWNLIVERRLPYDLVASVGYVGSAAVNNFAFLNINASQVIGSGDDGRPLFQKFGRTATTREFDGRMHSNYHSLQTTLNRRFKDGLLLKAAYTWSKAIDEAPYSDWTEYLWNASIVFDRNRAQADHNIPHNFQLGWVYELPFGPGKKWATEGTSGAILGGWQLNGLFAAYSGRPFTVTASDASLNMPGNQQTADQVKETVEKLGEIGDAGTFFDTSAFARVTEVRFGNVGRNTMRGPGVVNMDLSLFRSFKLNEQFTLQFRAEAFNVSNTPHFNNPDSDVNSGDFGRIFSTNGDIAAARSREFRFGLHLLF